MTVGDLQKDVELFSRYMALTGVASLEDEPGDDPDLRGKKLGIINGSAWISLYSYYFGRKALPGVKLIGVGCEAVQLNFMTAHRQGLPCPPQVNIDMFVQHAEDLVRLYGVDAIIVTCSTMNRAANAVRTTMARYGVPVIQIDEAMMEQAVIIGGRILIVATHGPTVKSTQMLLEESAAKLGRTVSFAGATVEEAFHLLGKGDVAGHNDLIARAIREIMKTERISVVVLAQLSMAVFKLSYPDPVASFGVQVLTSGETGFERVRQVLKQRSAGDASVARPRLAATT
jgi:Asp/Glu/hydantoin racemase